jgi:hypothetical protein
MMPSLMGMVAIIMIALIYGMILYIRIEQAKDGRRK